LFQYPVIFFCEVPESLKSIIQEEEELKVLLSFLVTRLFEEKRGEKRLSESLDSKKYCGKHYLYLILSPIFQCKAHIFL